MGPTIRIQVGALADRPSRAGRRRSTASALHADHQGVRPARPPGRPSRAHLHPRPAAGPDLGHGLRRATGGPSTSTSAGCAASCAARDGHNYFRTVRGVGYAFAPAAEARARPGRGRRAARRRVRSAAGPHAARARSCWSIDAAADRARRRRGRSGWPSGPRDQLAGMSLIAAFGSAALDARRPRGAGQPARRPPARRSWAGSGARTFADRRGAAAGGRAGDLRSTTSPACGASSGCVATSSPTSATSCARRWPRSSCWPRRCPAARWTIPRPRATSRCQIEREVDHLAQLVDELLDLSMIESGETKLAIEPVDPARWSPTSPSGSGRSPSGVASRVRGGPPRPPVAAIRAPRPTRRGSGRRSSTWRTTR